ncbi:polynucleotide 3'-phosphatase ZDP isoform X2 [Lathyrus oleraceus]|uniref:polynucleotide 3'-phosphatase ZDP isoform X2 n=1 Tax=Pisum sativum TaxID=3888 RepID=UPI0021CECA20|nr:polynucleotide 3'-phosphatase ZDP-like isoform X2 [Pisum sativum]
MQQIPKVFLLIASLPIFAISVNACSLSFQNLSMALSKVVAEYAKSNRSMCKKCFVPIQSKTLRLGLVSRGMARLLDITKWHHFSCFPISSSNSHPKTITGFSSLKSGDQEPLTKFFAGQDKSEDLSTSDVNSGVNITFSVSDVKSTYKDDGLQDSSKIAAFDFDGCLAKTAVNITGPNAWSLMYPVIPDKLQSLYNNGYKLVIFTNESNIERWKNQRQKAVDSKIGRLNQFIEKVKVPIQVFIACGTGKSGKAGTKEADPFRKPKPGMWQLMEKHFNSGITIDMNQSFYVGDAAGRKKDHSDADIKFAELWRIFVTTIMANLWRLAVPWPFVADMTGHKMGMFCFPL